MQHATSPGLRPSTVIETGLPDGLVKPIVLLRRPALSDETPRKSMIRPTLEGTLEPVPRVRIPLPPPRSRCRETRLRSSENR